MEISGYFTPLDFNMIQPATGPDSFTIGHFVQLHSTTFPELLKTDIVIIGAPEDKNGRELKGAAMAPDVIRRHLYRLASPKSEIKIADLGNLRKTERMQDYYQTLGMIVGELVKRGKLVIVLGGTQDVVYGQYRGYEVLGRPIEYVCIDSELDLMDSDFGINNHSYNHKILLHSPNYLFNYSNLGYQSHFVTLADRKRMKNLYFSAMRLGEIRNDIRECEPYLRNADMVSFDISAIRSSDAPGTSHPSPAGLDAEEACQIAKYAGMANRVSSISFCEVNPMRDLNEQTSLLTAMMIWYFIEGYYNRRDDEPINPESMTRYRLQVAGGLEEVIFLKNESSGRWWMEVPYHDGIGKPEARRKIIPCSESDYNLAKENELPERWWFAHNKLR